MILMFAILMFAITVLFCLHDSDNFAPWCSHHDYVYIIIQSFALLYFFLYFMITMYTYSLIKIPK